MVKVNGPTISAINPNLYRGVQDRNLSYFAGRLPVKRPQREGLRAMNPLNDDR
jgi:hypothetical protein